MVKNLIIKSQVKTESPEFQCIEVKKRKSFSVSKIRNIEGILLVKQRWTLSNKLIRKTEHV